LSFWKLILTTLLSHATVSAQQGALAALKRSSFEVAALLRVLSNPDRLLLLCHIAEGERCVGDLEGSTDIRQPTLSQQLTVLRNAKAVITRREGKQIFYSIRDARTLALMQTLHALYCVPKTKGKKK
jgi:DNA-binding transcriptional ArsR family regulator